MTNQEKKLYQVVNEMLINKYKDKIYTKRSPIDCKEVKLSTVKEIAIDAGLKEPIYVTKGESSITIQGELLDPYGKAEEEIINIYETCIAIKLSHRNLFDNIL